MMGKVFLAGQLMVLALFLQVITGAHRDSVLLDDVKVLTLHHGQMTNSRRTSPVPQLKCIGGSAGCAFKPQTVQCYNRGSDGYDVQWECKTDMDNSYRFGKLEVTCEGYDYPEDPYILKGSCGLEYTLDLTEEGWERKNAGSKSNHHDYGYHQGPQYNFQESYTKKASSVLSDLFYLAIIAGIVYVLYRTCIASNAIPSDQPPPYDDTFRSHDHHGSQQPPPYGFRSEYMPNEGASCSGTRGGQTYTAPGTGTGGGFWSGAFTGGVLGYMMGNRNNNYGGYQRPYTGYWGNRGWGTGWGTGWGNTGWGTGWGTGGGGAQSSSTFTTPSAPPSSTGTRTASGFGGTGRR